MPRAYREVRKTYITARVGENLAPPPYSTNWRKYHKEQACQEFDEFVAEERRQAVEQYKLDH